MVKSYVIRKGHYTDAQKKAYDSLSSKYLIPVPRDSLTSEYTVNAGKLDLKKTFFNISNVIMEIGFGSGTTTAEIAKVNPDNNYICIEVHRPGIGRLLWEIEKRNLSNIRIIEYDAVFVAEKMIPNNSLNAIHIFFPDPWPKKRHRKRRLVQRPFTEILANCLKPEGYIYMVTDWEDYADHALEELTMTSSLKNQYNGFALPQKWRPKTRFEQKGLEKNHVIRELLFIKNNIV
ncbi:MAG: tRNA (guanosine(46)-N7)-methyltransferase TrmB [Treponema sp.]|nr:tRNA (guanosine(46)-N7)-methyltransferase TrmB [Treponema sp.]